MSSEHQSRDALAYFIVHDLKIPLTVVLSNAAFLKSEAGISDEGRAAVCDILEAAEQMQSMLLNILDVGSAENGCLVANLESLNISALLDKIARSARRPAQMAGVELVLEKSADPVFARADAALVRRIVENFLDNCFKYAAKKGGRVTLRAALAAGGKIIVQVEDNGPGIPECQRIRIFEKHTRLERDVGKQARCSRGLGLAFCRLAAEAHGGRVWVEPADPMGSRFCVELPAA